MNKYFICWIDGSSSIEYGNDIYSIALSHNKDINYIDYYQNLLD